MRPMLYTDAVAWSVCQSVGLLVTNVTAAKTVEPIEMPFRTCRPTRVGPRNHVLDVVQAPRRNWLF